MSAYIVGVPDKQCLQALLEYEKYKMHGNELPLPAEPARVENQVT